MALNRVMGFRKGEIAPYIPVNEIEGLLLRAKHSLKEEANILRDRADIEKNYVKALKEWSKETKRKVDLDPLFDHRPVRLGLIMSLHECDTTAAVHEKVANLLTGPDGPMSKIFQYRSKHFKSKYDISIDIVGIMRSKEKVLQYFDKFLILYRQAVKECAECIKAAEEAVREENKIKQDLIHHQEKLNTLKTCYGNSVYYRQKVATVQKNLVNLDGLLLTATAKKENCIAKAKHILAEKSSALEQGVFNIAKWEAERVKFVSSQFGVAMDHISLLGNDAASSCNKAVKILGKVNPEDIMLTWEKEHMAKFNIKEIQAGNLVIDRKNTVKREMTHTKNSKKTLSLDSVADEDVTLRNDIEGMVRSPRTFTPTEVNSVVNNGKNGSFSNDIEGAVVRPARFYERRPTPLELFVTDRTSRVNDDTNNSCNRYTGMTDGEDTEPELTHISSSPLTIEPGAECQKTMVPSSRRRVESLTTEEKLFFSNSDIGLFNNLHNALALVEHKEKLLKIWGIRVVARRDPFRHKEGKTDMHLRVVLGYNDPTGEMLSLRVGQKVKMVQCSLKCGMGWGWLIMERRQNIKDKLCGKFPLICVEPSPALYQLND